MAHVFRSTFNIRAMVQTPHKQLSSPLVSIPYGPYQHPQLPFKTPQIPFNIETIRPFIEVPRGVWVHSSLVKIFGHGSSHPRQTATWVLHAPGQALHVLHLAGHCHGFLGRPHHDLQEQS